MASGPGIPFESTRPERCRASSARNHWSVRAAGRVCQIARAGSSREHAPWALEDYGFEAIVAPSFADIFYSNCTKIGLLPVVLPEEQVRALMAAGEGAVDLGAQEVRWPGGSASFEIDPETRRRLVNGLDDIGVTLQHADAIERYEAERERSGPATTALA